MEESNNYVKRSQRDYTLSFKINIVKEIEFGELSITDVCPNYCIQSRSTVLNWLRKFGKFDWKNKTQLNITKSPEQRILELEAKVKLLEKLNVQLDRQNYNSDSKIIIFDV